MHVRFFPYPILEKLVLYILFIRIFVLLYTYDLQFVHLPAQISAELADSSHSSYDRYINETFTKNYKTVIVNYFSFRSYKMVVIYIMIDWTLFKTVKFMAAELRVFELGWLVLLHKMTLRWVPTRHFYG